MCIRDRFCDASAFNGNIGAWDTSGVKTMISMFQSASAFNQEIGGWAVQSVTDMRYMFTYVSAFDQDLGWCVDDGVDLSYAFEGTQCASTSCGVVQMDNCPTPAPTPAPTVTPAGWFGSSSQTSNNDDVVDDDKMMTLVVLAGLLGLSLAAGLLLFALRQQQLAAKKPRAPRTFTVTAVQSV